jgi:hypothetical protein
VLKATSDLSSAHEKDVASTALRALRRLTAGSNALLYLPRPLGDAWRECNLRDQVEDPCETARWQRGADHDALPSSLCTDLCAEQFARLNKLIRIVLLPSLSEESRKRRSEARVARRL